MFKSPRIAWPLLCLLCLGLCPARESARLSVFDAIEAHLEASTVTLRETSVNFAGSDVGNDTAAYSVEAVIVPQFTLFRGRIGGPLRGAYLLNAAAKVVVRRSDGVGSNPVRTPSYIPSATLYYSPRDSMDASALWYLSGGVSHYSNGQEGPFLQSDGRTLNNVDGSFSLWSTFAAVHLQNDWPLLPAYKSVQVEYFHHKEGLLDALYPDYALSLRMQTRDYFHPTWHGLRGRAHALTDLVWNVRNPSALPDAMKPAPFSAALTGVYSPGEMFPALAFFGRFYAGFDYYNMNFDQEIYRLDAGLMLAIH